MFLSSLKKGAVTAGKVLGVGVAATTSVACTTMIATSVNKNKGFFKTQATLTGESTLKETATSRFKL